MRAAKIDDLVDERGDGRVQIVEWGGCRQPEQEPPFRNAVVGTEWHGRHHVISRLAVAFANRRHPTAGHSSGGQQRPRRVVGRKFCFQRKRERALDSDFGLIGVRAGHEVVPWYAG